VRELFRYISLLRSDTRRATYSVSKRPQGLFLLVLVTRQTGEKLCAHFHALIIRVRQRRVLFKFEARPVFLIWGKVLSEKGYSFTQKLAVTYTTKQSNAQTNTSHVFHFHFFFVCTRPSIRFHRRSYEEKHAHERLGGALRLRRLTGLAVPMLGDTEAGRIDQPNGLTSHLASPRSPEQP
jgi:hypothetical protein